VISLSGGVDSTVLLAYLWREGFEVAAVTVIYGQRHSCEVEAARKVAEFYGIRHEIVDLSDLAKVMGGSALTGEGPIPHGHYTEENQKITVVPNRNMILLGVATAFALSLGYSWVYYAAHSGDHSVYPDCRPEFVKAMEPAILLATEGKVSLSAPFAWMNKSQIVTLGKELGVPFGLTWSCYEGNYPVQCGKCGTCVERREAFEIAGIPDPVPYSTVL